MWLVKFMRDFFRNEIKMISKLKSSRNYMRKSSFIILKSPAYFTFIFFLNLDWFRYFYNNFCPNSSFKNSLNQSNVKWRWRKKIKLCSKDSRTVSFWNILKMDPIRFKGLTNCEYPPKPSVPLSLHNAFEKLSKSLCLSAHWLVPLEIVTSCSETTTIKSNQKI